MNVTMQTIANELEVSLTTVSNVLNNKSSRVSKETRKKVLDLVEKYNYTPNFNAKSLAKASSNLVGLLYYSDTPKFDYSDPFVSEVLGGVESVAREKGYFILLQNVSTLEDVIILQASWKFSGFIAVGFHQKMFNEIINSIKVPIVFIDTHVDHMRDRTNKDIDIVFVKSDDIQVAEYSVNYASERKHKNIGFLSYEFDVDIPGVIQQRYLGYLNGMNNNKLTVKNDLVFTHLEFERILKSLDEFSAILVTADILAMRLIKFLRENGSYDVSKTSIISIDDIEYSELNNPPLTTVRLHQTTKGNIAMQELINRMEGEDPKKISTIIIESEIIERKSFIEKNN